MSFSQRLELRQSQQLVMTPQLQQAIRMLQMSGTDIAAFVAEEVERNPVLELENPDRETAAAPVEKATPEIDNVGAAEDAFDTGKENLYEGAEAAPALMGGGGEVNWSGTGAGGSSGGEGFDFEDRLTGEETLRDHMLAQIAVVPATEQARVLARLLVDELDGAGYLRTDLCALSDRLGANRALVDEAVAILQSCEPTGVGARDLAECLALQLKEQNRYDPAMEALLAHLDDLAAVRFEKLQEACGVDQDDLNEMIAEIRALDPRPGAVFGGGVAQTVIPDVFVKQNNLGGWSVEVNSDALPKVLLDTRYAAELNEEGETEAMSFLAECKQNATWLIRSLDQRAQTILKVSSEIVKTQALFFHEGVSGLKPMTLKMVADEIGMHESTVSRVTSNKYMATERGLFELKFFFTQAISSTDGGDSHSSAAVQLQIKTLIENEDSKKTLSDDKIVKMLTFDGVNIARRTVAKYREGMNIPSSVQRRRLKAAALGR
ncbi:MAG: RNA polymerase factor sigma-54 [Paracoccaceae bacterium]|nr:RNA polymerase factor sigma-54 [Paracoccaceae bacterium]